MFKRGKHRALTVYQRRENRRRAKVRVEHVFASCQNELGGKFIRTIGLDRASVQMGLQNLPYNMHRLVFLFQTPDIQYSFIIAQCYRQIEKTRF